MTPEHRQKIADALRGKRHHHRSHKQTAEAREKIGAAHRGKHVSAETRAKMSAAHYGKSCPQRFGRMTPGRERVVRPTTRDIHWLAGFYEGEGCCIRTGSRRPAGGGDAAPAAREIGEARVETAADSRRRADQWAQIEGGVPATLEQLADGGLRLLATAGAVIGPSAVTSGATEYRSNDGGNSQPFIDPLSTVLSNITYAGVLVQWKGTSANASYGAVRAWLNPQFDTTKPQYVKTWRLDIYRVVLGTGQLFWQLQPWLHATVPIASAAAGWVTFTFQDNTGKPQPFHPEPGEGGLFAGNFTGYLVRSTGYAHHGNPATNLTSGYHDTPPTF